MFWNKYESIIYYQLEEILAFIRKLYLDPIYLVDPSFI